MRLHASVLFLSLAVTLSACWPAEEERAADVKAIQALEEEWTVAFNTSDATGLVALYTDDAVRMPPNAPAYTGKAEIEEAFSGLFERFSPELTWSVEEIVIGDSWAFDRGTYTFRGTPLAGGAAIEEVGKVIVIYQRQPDGSWKVAYEIWNLDHPQPRME